MVESAWHQRHATVLWDGLGETVNQVTQIQCDDVYFIVCLSIFLFCIVVQVLLKVVSILSMITLCREIGGMGVRWN